MGARASTLAQEDIEELQKISSFSATQLGRLYKRFKRLDKDDLGFISPDEFMSIPEFAMNPLHERLIAVFDPKHTEMVNFRRFVEVLAVFAEKADVNVKLKFVFRIYDVRNDGYITADELYEILKTMVGNHLTDKQLMDIAEQTVREADLDKDGKISFDEFCQSCLNSDVGSKLTIAFSAF